MTPVIYHPARLPDSSLGAFKNSFSSKMKQSVEKKGGRKVKREVCHVVGSLDICPLAAVVPA